MSAPKRKKRRVDANAGADADANAAESEQPNPEHPLRFDEFVAYVTAPLRLKWSEHLIDNLLGDWIVPELKLAHRDYLHKGNVKVVRSGRSPFGRLGHWISLFHEKKPFAIRGDVIREEYGDHVLPFAPPFKGYMDPLLYGKHLKKAIEFPFGVFGKWKLGEGEWWSFRAGSVFYPEFWLEFRYRERDRQVLHVEGRVFIMLEVRGYHIAQDPDDSLFLHQWPITSVDFCDGDRTLTLGFFGESNFVFSIPLPPVSTPAIAPSSSV